MRVLVIGGGGREHAIVWKLRKDGHHVICVPGNPGIRSMTVTASVAVEPEALAQLAKDNCADLTIVGPEAPLEAGIADVFADHGLTLFGPNKKAAQLESSKAFSKEFMNKHKIPTADYRICHSVEVAKAVAAEFCENGRGVVIKPSGLTAGKGVTVCHNHQEAVAALDEIDQYGDASTKIVVEERLKGVECSVQLFCDGKRMEMMPAAQDHKRLLNSDKGPNTGGMGAFAPTPYLTERLYHVVKKEVVDRTMDGLQAEGMDYRGVLYCGIMLTEDGPRVLEYNCRFGDPEAQVVLPLLESDLAEVCLACAKGKMTDEEKPLWSDGAAATVVMAAPGYPKSYPKGAPIEGVRRAEKIATVVFQAGTAMVDDELVTDGGRVLAVTGTGKTLANAIDQAYKGVAEIKFEGAHFRKDIGKKAVHTLAVV